MPTLQCLQYLRLVPCFIRNGKKFLTNCSQNRKQVMPKSTVIAHTVYAKQQCYSDSYRLLTLLSVSYGATLSVFIKVLQF